MSTTDWMVETQLLHAAWNIRHVRWTCLFYISFTRTPVYCCCLLLPLLALLAAVSYTWYLVDTIINIVKCVTAGCWIEWKSLAFSPISRFTVHRRAKHQVYSSNPETAVIQSKVRGLTLCVLLSFTRTINTLLQQTVLFGWMNSSAFWRIPQFARGL